MISRETSLLHRRTPAGAGAPAEYPLLAGQGRSSGHRHPWRPGTGGGWCEACWPPPSPGFFGFCPGARQVGSVAAQQPRKSAAGSSFAGAADTNKKEHCRRPISVRGNRPPAHNWRDLCRKTMSSLPAYASHQRRSSFAVSIARGSLRRRPHSYRRSRLRSPGPQPIPQPQPQCPRNRRWLSPIASAATRPAKRRPCPRKSPQPVSGSASV
jgi:hypothetical protein